MRFLFSYGLDYSFLLIGLGGLSACTSPVTDPNSTGPTDPYAKLPTQCVNVLRGKLGTVADAQIASDPSGTQQSRNFGSSALLNAGPFNGGQSHLLIKLDPGQLPPVLAYLSATLQLQVSKADSGAILAYQVPVPWDEATVTWNSFYAAVDPSQLTQVAVGSIPAGTSLLNMDIGQFAYSTTKGTPNYGLLLMPAGNDPWIFASSETIDPTYRPSVEICFHPDLCANITCSALDQCHTAGTCDPSTGKCPNPAKPDGMSCDDGASVTSSDVCVQGVCKGKPAQGNVYPLFSGGPGFTCTTGSKVWVLSSGALSPTSSAQAQAACEACYGTGNCYNSDEDSGGLSWGPKSATQPSCGEAYFGYSTGITGDNGRAWAVCNSSKTFGYWGKQP